MSLQTTRPARPPIVIGETDADRLFALTGRWPAARDHLLGELERAQVRADHRMPAGVVRMNAVVEFIDEARGESRTVQLVYPPEADIAAGKVSVMTPVGAALIGLREGQAIDWPDRDGRVRRLRVLKVTPALA